MFAKAQLAFKNSVFLSALLFVSVWLIYYPVAGFGFIHFDDHKYVTQNPFVLNGLSWGGLKWAFLSWGVDNWIPLTWLSHMFDVQLFGLHAGMHHVINVLLHAANSILIFVIFDRLTARRFLSWLIALIFAVHPLHVESVAWIAERKDVLSTFFILLAFLAYIKAVTSDIRVARVEVLICFAFSLICKPMYVTFPLLLLILDFWPLQRFVNPKEMVLCAVEKWPVVFFAAISAVVTLLAQHSAGAVFESTEFPLGHRLIASALAMSCYIQKFFFPVPLSVFYPPFAPGDFDKWGGSALIFFLGVTLLTVISFRKQNQWVLAGWLLFLIVLLPVVGLVKAGAQAMADRYTYFAYAGLSILLLWTGEAWIRRKSFLKIPFICALVLWLGFCFVKASDRVHDWQNTEKLFQAAVEIHPKNYVAYKVLADDAYSRGDFQTAVKYLNQALNVLPAEAESARLDYELNLAIAYQQSKNLEIAAEFYEKVSDRMPLRTDLIVVLGDIYKQVNQPARARLQYERALQLMPGREDIQKKLAEIRKV